MGRELPDELPRRKRKPTPPPPPPTRAPAPDDLADRNRLGDHRPRPVPRRPDPVTNIPPAQAPDLGNLPPAPPDDDEFPEYDDELL
jgi:hypothetical protein